VNPQFSRPSFSKVPKLPLGKDTVTLLKRKGVTMQVEVSGPMLLCFAHACVNHQIVMKNEVAKFIDDKDIVSKWFPLQEYVNLCQSVEKKYSPAEPVLVQIGVDMMKIWYEAIGKTLVKTGIEFLKFQTSSQGYYNVVKGPANEIGAFTLEALDEAQGKAAVVSSTPLNRFIEKGVLLGGISLFKDFSFVEVNLDAAHKRFAIEFH
jgi:hypothetical protein